MPADCGTDPFSKNPGNLALFWVIGFDLCDMIAGFDKYSERQDKMSTFLSFFI